VINSAPDFRERHFQMLNVAGPLTNFGQALDFVSCGLRILSHKGRGRTRGTVSAFRSVENAEEGQGDFTSPLVGEDTQAERTQ